MVSGPLLVNVVLLLVLGLNAIDDAAEGAAEAEAGAEGVDTLLVTISMGFECGTEEGVDDAEDVLGLKRVEAGMMVVMTVVAGIGNPRASLGSLEEELESERLGSLEVERRVGMDPDDFL